MRIISIRSHPIQHLLPNYHIQTDMPALQTSTTGNAAITHFTSDPLPHADSHTTQMNHNITYEAYDHYNIAQNQYYDPSGDSGAVRRILSCSFQVISHEYACRATSNLPATTGTPPYLRHHLVLPK